jgi:hypothetical protein
MNTGGRIIKGVVVHVYTLDFAPNLTIDLFHSIELIQGFILSLRSLSLVSGVLGVGQESLVGVESHVTTAYPIQFIHG